MGARSMCKELILVMVSKTPAGFFFDFDTRIPNLEDLMPATLNAKSA